MLFKENNTENGDKNTEKDDKRIGDQRIVFRHPKVHAVPADDQCQRHENHRDDGEYFHNVVHTDIDLRLVDVYKRQDRDRF